MWGTDCNHAEGIYGATEFTRRCLAEVLAERRERGELTEEHARRIGKQILRDNALTLFPQLKERLWKRKGKPIRPKTKEIKLCTRTGSIVGWPPGFADRDARLLGLQTISPRRLTYQTVKETMQFVHADLQGTKKL